MHNTVLSKVRVEPAGDETVTEASTTVIEFVSKGHMAVVEKVLDEEPVAREKPVDKKERIVLDEPANERKSMAAKPHHPFMVLCFLGRLPVDMFRISLILHYHSLSIFGISFSRIYSFPATTSRMKVCYLMVRMVVVD